MSGETDIVGAQWTLSDKIKALLKGIRAETGGVREVCVTTGHRAPAVANAMSDVVLRLISIEAYLKSLEVIAAAERMTQRLEPVTVQGDVGHLPLFAGVPVMSTREHEQMLQTLHRAGDHSLDEENTDALLRGPTMKEVA
jgi:hypothetical protein